MGCCNTKTTKDEKYLSENIDHDTNKTTNKNVATKPKISINSAVPIKRTKSESIKDDDPDDILFATPVMDDGKPYIIDFPNTEPNENTDEIKPIDKSLITKTKTNTNKNGGRINHSIIITPPQQTIKVNKMKKGISMKIVVSNYDNDGNKNKSPLSQIEKGNNNGGPIIHNNNESNMSEISLGMDFDEDDDENNRDNKIDLRLKKSMPNLKNNNYTTDQTLGKGAGNNNNNNLTPNNDSEQQRGTFVVYDNRQSINVTTENSDDEDDQNPFSLEVEELPKHLRERSDSMESLDPDFVLEAAYFENNTDDDEKASLLKSDSNNFNMDTINSFNSMDLTQSIKWDKPGIPIDSALNFKSIEMQSIEIVQPNIKKPKKQTNNNDNKNDDDGDNNDDDIKQDISSNRGNTMNSEQLIKWQIQGRKLRHMSHNQLINWLEKSGIQIDRLTMQSFKKNKITGQQLWNNIRNASMFLYNVGCVRPTLRDAIVQNIYMQLMPKTPGFDERKIEDFRNIKLISNGPISTVYKAVYKKHDLNLRDSTLVIKGYHFEADKVRVGKIIQILYHMVNKVKSNNFIKIYGFIRNMNKRSDTKSDYVISEEKEVHNEQEINTKFGFKRQMFGIVMEYADDKSLSDVFLKNFDYNIMDKIGILIDIASAMNELHELKLLHKNLKATNVLLSEDDIKLTDYCLDITQLMDFTFDDDQNERSIRYMAPELIKNCEYDQSTDIYSFGILMYEILTNKQPYYEYPNFNEIIKKVLKRNNYIRPNIEIIKKNYPKDIITLMKKCWDYNPEIRPPFISILNKLDIIQDKLRKTRMRWDDDKEFYNNASNNELHVRSHSHSLTRTSFVGNNKLPITPVSQKKHFQNETFLLESPKNDIFDTENTHHKKFKKSVDDLDIIVLDNINKQTRRHKPKKYKPKKKRPRKPLPKAIPKKQLPTIIKTKDKVLPPTPLMNNNT